MLENIKSSFFIKILFFSLYDKTLLKLIKYSTKWQKYININLINYKIFSGKYIIYETKEKGKIYDALNDTLLYEGGIKDGKKNGKGKEYNEIGTIIHEGEYFNGKRKQSGSIYGFIEQYDKDGNLVLKTNNITDKINGIIKEYNMESQLIFEGEYLNGERNGKGKEYEWIPKQTYYVCELDNDYPTIKVKDWSCNLIYEGEYLNGERHGKGKGKEYKYGSLVYEGEYFNGEKWNGKEGKTEYLNGIIWNSPGTDLLSEMKEGKGFIIEYPPCIASDYGPYGYQIECELINGKKNGKGKEYFVDFLNNVKELIYEGEYLNGKRNGKGKEYCEGIITFDGEYLYDYKRKGKSYINGKLEFEGEYLYDRKWNGKGFDENGNIIYELINGNGKIKDYNSE